MNHFKFEDIKIGDEVEFSYEITEDKMNKFRDITGDINYLHNDAEYANKKGYPERVVSGMLTSSFLSTLAGVYMPGEYSLIHSVEINYIKPVFLSSSPLKIKAKVIEKEERFKQIELKYYITDKEDKKVCRGNMKIGFIKEE